MLRLFAGIAIPEDIWDDLEAMMDEIPGARWRLPEQYHITLCFFGELSHAEARDLDSLLIGVRAPPFELQLEGAGWFGKRNPDSLHARVKESAALREIARGCERAARQLGRQIERGPFVPHVTLAYLNGTDLADARAWTGHNHGFLSGVFRVEAFHLYSSRTGKSGSQYVAEADYDLA
jgi:RNA 2',3'-cyclic 3'-phosphodiesterase